MIKKKKIVISAESIRDLRRINTLLVFLAFLFIILMLFLFEEIVSEIIIIAIKTSLYIFLVSNLLLLILQYSYRKFPLDKFRFKLLRYSLSYFSGIVIYLILWPIFAKMAGLPSRMHNLKLMTAFVAIATLLTTIVLLLHDFIIYRHNKVLNELEFSQLELRSSQAENLLLKQQIHPHFLFNSLNTLKALYKKDRELGEHYLLQLSDFLRSAVTHNDQQDTTLKEELRFCKNYLEMQKIRFGNALEWNITIVDRKSLNDLVPSFSIQPLLENAIKHNVFTVESPLRINIFQDGDLITVSNLINQRNAGEASVNSGLGNLAERYLLWCGEEIIIKNDGINFSVAMKIIKNEDYNY
ncbi:histidine kinase [Chryseobacterium sp. C39-AII1]|uniref:sensor histidine kinase n=1 Tax=Chryseobacterium sp. C39-AII1 TaxID=3080332 RepID=UPI0032081AB1